MEATIEGRQQPPKKKLRVIPALDARTEESAVKNPEKKKVRHIEGLREDERVENKNIGFQDPHDTIREESKQNSQIDPETRRQMNRHKLRTKLREARNVRTGQAYRTAEQSIDKRGKKKMRRAAKSGNISSVFQNLGINDPEALDVASRAVRTGDMNTAQYPLQQRAQQNLGPPMGSVDVTHLRDEERKTEVSNYSTQSTTIEK
jgi:hypothetical protein